MRLFRTASLRSRCLMSRLLPFAVGLLFVLRGAPIAHAQSTYPTVYGSTGHPYGPTQAAYQYHPASA